MFKKDVAPLSDSVIDSIGKTINRIQYVEEKASRPADSSVGDVQPQDVSGEEEVKADASAKKAPARKGDQAQADSMEKVDEATDPVNPKAVKKKFDDRKDKDIDNDGDTDSSDEYLHKRRKAISKALAKEENANFNQPITEKMGDDDWVHIARAGSFYNPKKDKIIGYSKSPKDPNRSPKIKAGANSAMRIGDAKKKGFAIKEEVELEEAKNYEYKDGKVHISKANFRKVHKDYKNTTRGKERMMVLDPKTQGSVSAPVVFTEAKTDYTINHKTFSSAVQHAVDVVKKRGFEVDNDEYDRKVAMGPRKPGKGKTNRYIIALTKGGKPTRKNLHMQVYYDEGRYELNMYID